METDKEMAQKGPVEKVVERLGMVNTVVEGAKGKVEEAKGMVERLEMVRKVVEGAAGIVE